MDKEKLEKLRKKYCTCHIVGCNTCNLIDEILGVWDEE